MSAQATPPSPYIYDEQGALQLPEHNLGYALGDSTLEDMSQNPFMPTPDEKPECVVFVHGIDMTIDAQQGYAQSFFKRLWWEGYQGRFVTFRWPTVLSSIAMFSPTGTNMQIFNAGEYRSWKAGTALKKYMVRLKSELPANSTVSLVAHSLGNACAAEALRQGMQVDNFVSMEAAVPLSSYFQETQSVPAEESLVRAELKHQQTNPATPEYESQGGYHGYLASIRVNINNNFACYYNKDDFWLMTGKTAQLVTYVENPNPHEPPIKVTLEKSVDWLTNEETAKPSDRIGPGEYSVQPIIGPWFEYEGIVEHQRPVRDPHEIMAFVSRPRTRALGSLENDSMLPPGVDGVNMNGPSGFGFATSRIDHSGQFQRDIQYMYEDGEGNKWNTPFYEILMSDLNVSSSLTPTP